LTATFSCGAMTGGAHSACALAPLMHANALAGPVRTRALPAPLMVASPAAHVSVHCEERAEGPVVGQDLAPPPAVSSAHSEGRPVCAQNGIAHREKKRKVGGNGDREKRAASAYNLVLQAKVEEL
jgi:hypothetical protein